VELPLRAAAQNKLSNLLFIGYIAFRILSMLADKNFHEYYALISDSWIAVIAISGKNIVSRRTNAHSNFGNAEIRNLSDARPGGEARKPGPKARKSAFDIFLY